MKNAMYFMLGMMFLSAPAYAAKVEVSWGAIADFTDMEAVNERRDRFQARMQKGLADHLEELAKSLPDANTLQVTFNDVDLAGRVEPTFGNAGTSHQRILDDLAYPRLDISYRYVSSNGELLSEGENVVLKSLAPMNTRRDVMGSSRETLYFEKKLLSEWFSDTFQSSN